MKIPSGPEHYSDTIQLLLARRCEGVRLCRESTINVRPLKSRPLPILQATFTIMASTQDLPTLCPVSVTDCPHCGAVCLGAITLPCGHLCCRKCFRHLLQQHGGLHLTCGLCKQHLPLPEGCSRVSQVVQQLGTDPVVHDLVQLRLLREKHLCHIHKKTTATMVCEDCREFYCDDCCHIHRRLGATTDHVLRLLPKAGHHSPSASSAPPGLRAFSTSSIPSALSIGNLSVISAESSLNIAMSGGENEARQQFQKVVTLLQEASSKKHTFVSSLKELASVFNQVLSTEAAQDELLRTYTDRLSCCDVTELIDPHTFVITGGIDDSLTTMTIHYLERRILDVIDRCQLTSVTSAERIATMLLLHSDLLHCHGEITI